jgi:hypothetical protein
MKIKESDAASFFCLCSFGLWELASLGLWFGICEEATSGHGNCRFAYIALAPRAFLDDAGLNRDRCVQVFW